METHNNSHIELDSCYELLKALGLIDEESETTHDNVLDTNSPENSEDNRESDEESDEEMDDEWYYRYINKKTEGWDRFPYGALYGQKALDELNNSRMSRHRNIVIREFTNRLPEISDEAKNQLYDAFSSSSAFNVDVHNKLLDALAHPIYGWKLTDYDY